MKKFFLISMLISLAMICSCQRKESAAEPQLDQRKVDLDAREEELAERKSALDERLNSLEKKVNSLDQRVKELAEKEKTAVNTRTNPTDTQVQVPNPAQLQAERESLVQQFSDKAPPPSQAKAEKAEKDSVRREQLGQRQQEEKLKAVESKWHAAGMSGGAVFPAPAGTYQNPAPAAATSPNPSSAEEATSPNPSPTPE